jgi:hypothetical protein
VLAKRLPAEDKTITMGRLTYDGRLTVDFDDRVLAHLQLVIGAKLRRNEAFFFSWTDDADSGGRSALWMHPTISVYFKFTGSRQPWINRSWLDELMLTANTPAGLQIVPEPEVAEPAFEGHSRLSADH